MRAHLTHIAGIAILIGMVFVCGIVLGPFSSEARYISTFRDLLSDSAPGAYANHTVSFTADAAIPPGGFIRITPDSAFTIPGATFDEDQVELYVDDSLRPASSTADADFDGVTIVSGSPSSVEITLNSTTGISSGATVRLLLGTHTANSTTTDTGIQNPSATGTAPVLIEFGGGESGRARALVAIVDQVGVGPVDTRETQPPQRFNGEPSGTIAGTVTSAEVSLETDEFATCRYDNASGTPYFSMGSQFTTTGSVYHILVVTGILPETNYSFYVRCIDDEGNFNTDDYVIEFIVAPTPEGEPGEGDEDGGGSDDGSGSGSSGSGSGSGGGDTSGSGGGGGGTRGGGSGGGGLDSDDIYESGDATVIINGFAFPGSQIVTLVDGDEFDDSETADSSGEFSVTVPEIARGVYTFGVYAIDRDGTKSSTFSTTFSVIGSRVSNLSNIHLMPTIKVTPDPVSPGADVTFSGYAIQNSTVTIETQPDKSNSGKKTFTTTSDGSGRWSTTQSTAGFTPTTWKVRAKSAQSDGGISTQFSQYTTYGVGAAVPTTGGNNSDLNRDGKVNLIDFSILLFHWNTDGGTSDPPADINRDGRVSLTDFSIMIFNWTG